MEVGSVLALGAGVIDDRAAPAGMLLQRATRRGAVADVASLPLRARRGLTVTDVLPGGVP